MSETAVFSYGFYFRESLCPCDKFVQYSQSGPFVRDVIKDSCRAILYYRVHCNGVIFTTVFILPDFRLNVVVFGRFTLP